MLRRARTAILVVHGMGSQRPLDTARGLVDALCIAEKDTTKRPPETRYRCGSKWYKVWMHPLRAGSDIDLPVITMSPQEDVGRQFEFHEIYWAHVVSGPRAAAVLLWLFELARTGSRLPRDVKPLWYVGATFLCLFILSIAYLGVQAVIAVAGIAESPHPLLSVPALLLFLVGMVAGIYSMAINFHRLALLSLLLALVGAVFLVLAVLLVPRPDILKFAIMHLLPLLIAGLAAWLLMGSAGLRAFGVATGLSLWYALIPYVVWWIIPDKETAKPLVEIVASYTTVASCLIILVYAGLNAAFLQHYLGDAARYFRNAPANVEVRRRIRGLAVDTLDALHKSGRYDRIIVVAHSLGSVIAYDMLRTYFARICDRLPAGDALLGPQFTELDRGVDDGAGRRGARALVARMASSSENAWLVTDFITLGSPLTHGKFLLSASDPGADMNAIFERHKAERDIPTCPPRKADGTGHLAFANPRRDKAPQFHHGAVFGLTRWTNLFFPRDNLFWGDEVGGPLRADFGDGVRDVPVFTNTEKKISLFAHTSYWDIDTPLGHGAPHIKELVNALDLEDRDKP